MAKIETYEKWKDWAIRLQSLAQAGCYYTQNPYEAERYEEIRNIACDIMACHSNFTMDQVKNFFCCEIGYQTPKVETRAICFNNSGQLLMVQENDGKWSLPGGWCDVELSVAENCIKEAREEAGAEVVPQYIVCVHDWKKHMPFDTSNMPYHITKIFFMCDLKSINFQPNSETLQCNFFSRDNLPELSYGKNMPDQIDICFEAYAAKQADKPWKTRFE